MLLATLGFIVLLVIAVVIFVNTAPQFGRVPEGADLERIKQSPHYKDGQFVNLIDTPMASFMEAMKKLPDFFSVKRGKPEVSLPVKFGANTSPPVDSVCFVTWYGHSTFLIEMEGKRMLIDPMFGDVSAPISFGAHRFKYAQPIPAGAMKNIDAVIISHDHYDHLDYPSIVKLKDKVGHFYTALGVGAHLKSWGVAEDKITELDWWQEADYEGIKLVACPARHFSGRSFTDRNATQWASWIVKGKYNRLYFSGDSGFGPHFKEIGEQYGPFDLAMMECGQYNESWANIHMMPEESVQAGVDVKGKLLMPIHWGAFQLALHEWTDPIERFKNESERLKIPMVHPLIGERFSLGQDFPREVWWMEK